MEKGSDGEKKWLARGRAAGGRGGGSEGRPERFGAMTRYIPGTRGWPDSCVSPAIFPFPILPIPPPPESGFLPSSPGSFPPSLSALRLSLLRVLATCSLLYPPLQMRPARHTPGWKPDLPRSPLLFFPRRTQRHGREKILQTAVRVLSSRLFSSGTGVIGPIIVFPSPSHLSGEFAPKLRKRNVAS